MANWNASKIQLKSIYEMSIFSNCDLWIEWNQIESNDHSQMSQNWLKSTILTSFLNQKVMLNRHLGGISITTFLCQKKVNKLNYNPPKWWFPRSKLAIFCRKKPKNDPRNGNSGTPWNGVEIAKKPRFSPFQGYNPGFPVRPDFCQKKGLGYCARKKPISGHFWPFWGYFDPLPGSRDPRFWGQIDQKSIEKG